jgi:hypothetical protein
MRTHTIADGYFEPVLPLRGFRRSRIEIYQILMASSEWAKASFWGLLYLDALALSVQVPGCVKVPPRSEWG